MVLDLVDFKDRVRPLSKDISIVEYAAKYQKQNVEQMLGEREQFRQMLSEVHNDKFDRIEQAEGEGYSSMEIPEPKEKNE